MKKLIYPLAFVLIVNYTLNTDDCYAQWQPDVRLTNDTARSWISSNNAWSVAASGNVVHAVWEDFRDGNGEIYYKRSTDGGIIWGADTRLTNNAAVPWYYSVAVSGSVVLVLWQDFRDGNYEIYCKRSTDAGASWGADTRLTNNPSDSYYPSVTASGSAVNVVWEDFRDGNWEIYYKRSTDAGVSWGADTRLTNNSAGSEDPCIAVSGPVVQIVWDDYRDGDWEIYCKRSTDAGVSWGADTRLTNNNADSRYPSVAASGPGVHVVWEDIRDGNWEVYYKRSTDGGVSWGSDSRLTLDTAISYLPTIAVSGSVVHVVWEDHRDGNAEIYYKRNPNGNPTGIKEIISEIPSKYSLHQNFPNPFNPSTTIQYVIPKSGMVKLVVFDALGREVETLVSESQQAGTFEVSFDGSSYPSGVYFYIIKSYEFSETKKMILVK